MKKSVCPKCGSEEIIPDPNGDDCMYCKSCTELFDVPKQKEQELIDKLDLGDALTC
jgi:transcription initiation factor TFIIIB Brf1 subunit/transcription initiation factor TFIIB